MPHSSLRPTPVLANSVVTTSGLTTSFAGPPAVRQPMSNTTQVTEAEQAFDAWADHQIKLGELSVESAADYKYLWMAYVGWCVAQDSAWSEVLDRLARMIPTTDSSARRRRVAALGTAMFALLAERERTAGSPSTCAGSLDEVIEMLAAMLTAPVPAVAKLTRLNCSMSNPH